MQKYWSFLLLQFFFPGYVIFTNEIKSKTTVETVMKIVMKIVMKTMIFFSTALVEIYRKKIIVFITVFITIFSTVSTVVFNFISFMKITYPEKKICNSTNGQYFCTATTVRNYGTSTDRTKVVVVKNLFVDKKQKNSVLTF